MTALATLLVIVAGLGMVSLRLSQGPIDAGFLRPAAERLLAGQVSGGKARIRAMDIAWFDRAGAAGLELRGLSLVDGKGRPVLAARQLQAGVSLKSLLMFTPAPGRFGAENFFAALSVSPKGRYALGYDAAGAPGRAAGLWGSFDDLIGKPRAGHPLSFLGDVDLSDGVVSLRQVGGPVAWTGKVATVKFHKRDGRLDAGLDLAVDRAWIRAEADGAVGLGKARVSWAMSEINLAHLLPWVGPTAQLSVLNAAVQGNGALSWTSVRGMLSGDIKVQAGQGTVRLDGGLEPFHSGELRAAYDPASQKVLIRSLGGSSARGDVALSGAVWLSPERAAGEPARLELALGADRARLSFAKGKTPLPMQDLTLRGRYVARTGRIDIDKAGFLVSGVPVSVQGVLRRPRDRRSWGVDLRGGIGGMLSAREVLALWPDGLSDDARDWMDGHIQAGRLGRARFFVRLAPGEAAPHRAIANEHMRLTWDVEDADVLVDPSLPRVERVRGVGVLQGDRLDLTIRTASAQSLALSEGLVSLPHLIGANKQLEIRGRALGDASTMLQIVDRATDGGTSAHGFAPSRLAGQGDVSFSVGRPFDEASAEDYDVAFSGTVRDAVVQDAAPGLALQSKAVGVEGSLDRVAVKGNVELGPFHGALDYESRFPRGRAMIQKTRLDGVLDASTFGLSGPAGSTVPFAAHFDSAGDSGRGVIRSKAFDGQLSWRPDGGARFVAQGVANTAVWRAIGIPVAKGAPSRLPARLTLARTSAGWTGALDADLYSGTLVMTDGPGKRLRYVADLSPSQARRLGLSVDPGVTGPTPLVLDAAATGDAGEASYRFGAWAGRLNWSQDKDDKARYRWRTSLTPADLRAMGLPVAVRPTAPVPIDVTLTADTGGWSGTGQVAGGVFRFASRNLGGGLNSMSVSGVVDGGTFAGLGLGPDGMIAGPANVSANLVMAAEGVRSGKIDLDLQSAALSAPFVQWRKPAGRQMKVGFEFARRADGGWDATTLRGQGPGFALTGSGSWDGDGQGRLDVSNLSLDGAFDGSLQLTDNAAGQGIQAKGRYFDARRLIEMGGGPSRAAAAISGASGGGARTFHIDAQLGQVRVSQEGLVRNVRIGADFGGAGQRKLSVAMVRDDGGRFLDLQITPDPAGDVVSGQATDVGDAALALFGLHSFKGGKASLNGRLTPGGADLHITMTNVRLVKAPAVARILTIGSLKGSADMLNGSGIEFTRVEAPVSIKGSRLTIGRARATGPAMGLTTQGVIDIDNHTVDLQGGIAPSYVLNSAAGVVPIVGALLVSHKGEGLFGLTYSAKGAFASPKISVNPFSLATPGILRRIFEGRNAATAGG